MSVCAKEVEEQTIHSSVAVFSVEVNVSNETSRFSVIVSRDNRKEAGQHSGTASTTVTQSVFGLCYTPQ